jgi:signal transduction histidine kinase
VSANDLILYTNWGVYLFLFGRVLRQALRHPWRVNIDVALLFSVPVLNALINAASRLGMLPPIAEIRNVVIALLLLVALLLFRLADDFVIVDRRLQRVLGGAMLLLVLVVLVVPVPQPVWLSALAFLAVIGLQLYGAVAFLRGARLVSGVTRRRMQVVGIGSLLFVATFLLASPALLWPELRGAVMLVSNSVSLAAGLCYFVGFAPPRLLRRAWQEPELRAFLGRAAHLPRLPERAQVLAEFERGAAAALGSPGAALGLWHEPVRALRFERAGREVLVVEQTPSVLTQVWRDQRPVFVDHGLRTDAGASALAPPACVAALVAPVAVGDTRLGVLAVFAARVPIFADDDLALVQLLADQAAVILESRALIEEAARVRARDETARLKEDFLAAAAHDLKTPLTALVGRAQLLARRAARQPEAPPDLASIDVLVRESQRLKRLIQELLDVSRVQQGALVTQRSAVDLAALARDVCERHNSALHPCIVHAPEPVVGSYDGIRIEQLLENLVENAVKYSPDGGVVDVVLRRVDGEVLLSVADHGIGIPEEDLPQVFERFHRAGNAESPHFSGMGLGLFICRGIVEQHGGHIAVASRPGRGTTFRVTLPFVPAEQTAEV